MMPKKINVIYPGHYGPIYAIQRHPFFNKIFLTIGDWTLRIWSEEIHDDYIFSTKPKKFYLTDAQWCPRRPAVFICSTTEGSIHIWDLLFKQNEPTLTIKVKIFMNSSIHRISITCLTFQDQGRYLACGTKDGNVILTQLSDSLCIPDRNEKQLVSTIFDRETRRALYLPSDDELKQSTEQFWSMINQEKSNLLFS